MMQTSVLVAHLAFLPVWFFFFRCVCVYMHPALTDWGTDSMSSSVDFSTTSNSCLISQFLSLSIPTILPCLYVWTAVSVQPQAASLSWIYNDAFHTAALRSSNALQPTFEHDSFLWPRPLGWVNISIIYRKSPTNRRGPSRRRMVRVVI